MFVKLHTARCAPLRGPGPHWGLHSRHTDKSRLSRYRDIGKMIAITVINGIQKNIFKNCILAFLAVFPCFKQAPNLFRATLSLHKHL